MIAGNVLHLEPRPERDYCTRSGAEALAGTIRQFWIAFSYPDVLVWTEQARGAQVRPRRGHRQPAGQVKCAASGGELATLWRLFPSDGAPAAVVAGDLERPGHRSPMMRAVS